MKILATICARGGSKGIPDKNLLKLDDKPLIAHTIECLKNWGRADRIICSTDSKKISKIAKQYGAETPFLRPKNISEDFSPKHEALRHALQFCEKQDKTRYDIIVDLEPTSPIRKPKHLEEAYKKFLETNSDNLYSVIEAHANPYYTLVELVDGHPVLCKKPDASLFYRQQAPEVYRLNGSIYFYKRDFLLNNTNLHTKNTAIYLMPNYCIDIDTMIDYIFVKILIELGGYFKNDNL